MNKIDTTSALLQMQRMAAQAKVKPPTISHAKPETNQPQNFAELLKMGVQNVNQAQKLSGSLKKAFEMGDPNIDLPQVMVASQKSGLAFKAMLEVRTKLMTAYKDIMSMPV